MAGVQQQGNRDQARVVVRVRGQISHTPLTGLRLTFRGGNSREKADPKERNHRHKDHAKVLWDDSEVESLDRAPDGPVLEEDSLVLDMIQIFLNTSSSFFPSEYSLEGIDSRHADQRTQK
jgi:hypothetical protein